MVKPARLHLRTASKAWLISYISNKEIIFHVHNNSSNHKTRMINNERATVKEKKRYTKNTRSLVKATD